MKHQRGFTIAELMIVVIIAAVLAAIAAPNMSEFVKNNARATRVNTMVSALSFARGQAVSRNERVSLCRSSTPFTSCDAVGTGHFEGGWIVFTDFTPPGVVFGGNFGAIDLNPLNKDVNGDGVVDALDDESVLRIFQPDMGTNATLVGDNDGGFIGGLSYEGTGVGRDLTPAAGVDLVSANTEFRYCDDRLEDEARRIVISPTGSTRLSQNVASCP